MTAQELLEELEQLVDKYGDCPVTTLSDEKVAEVRAYDENGDFDGPVVEFCLIIER